MISKSAYIESKAAFFKIRDEIARKAPEQYRNQDTQDRHRPDLTEKAGFKIGKRISPVHHTPIMQILQAIQDLPCVNRYLRILKAISLIQGSQRLLTHKFKEYIKFTVLLHEPQLGIKIQFQY